MATKVYRFALGSPESPRSGMWRVWTHEDEVRASVRTAVEDVSLTAYPTGRFRITQGTHISKWDRPREFRPGWMQGPSILIPHSPLPVQLSPAAMPTEEPIAWLPLPPPGHYARITLLFAGPRAEQSRWRPSDLPNTQHLTILPLRTLGALHLDRLDTPLLPEELGNPSPPSVTQLVLGIVISADAAGQPSIWETHAP